MKEVLLDYYYQNSLTLNIIIFLVLALVLILSYIYKNQIKKIYVKNKELINYIIVGALTTLVSVSSYWLFRFIIKNYIILSVISWIMAVAFAYITNRIFVFNSKNKNIIEEIIKFFSCRLLTLGLEVILMMLFVSIFKINDMVSKIILQFVVLALNYVFSKIFIFKKEEKK